MEKPRRQSTFRNLIKNITKYLQRISILSNKIPTMNEHIVKYVRPYSHVTQKCMSSLHKMTGILTLISR